MLHKNFKSPHHTCVIATFVLAFRFILCNNCNHHHSDLKHACMYSVLVLLFFLPSSFQRRDFQNNSRLDRGCESITEKNFPSFSSSILLLERDSRSRIFSRCNFSEQSTGRTSRKKKKSERLFTVIQTVLVSRESGKASLERLQAEMESRRLLPMIAND